MKAFLQVIEQKSTYTSNLGLKFWWWALETIIHRFYLQEFLSNQKKLQFTRPIKHCSSGLSLCTKITNPVKLFFSESLKLNSICNSFKI